MAPHLSHDPLDVEVERVVRLLRNVSAPLDVEDVWAPLGVFFDGVVPEDAATLDAAVRRLPLSAAGSVIAAVVHERPRPTAPSGDDVAAPAGMSKRDTVETSPRGAVALSDDEWAGRLAALRRALTSN